jgi:F0F1-type ATP synthase membrane subunit b/b'
MTLAAAALGAFAETAEEAPKLLGLPLWIWQLANLISFLAVLAYFVARPLAEAFRRRQEAVEERTRQARHQREEAARLEAEIHERMARLDRELVEVRARGLAEGEVARLELIQRTEEEVERVRREVDHEITRRLAFAREELRRAAAELTAAAAAERLSAEITEDDRRRLIEEGVVDLARRP